MPRFPRMAAIATVLAMVAGAHAAAQMSGGSTAQRQPALVPDTVRGDSREFVNRMTIAGLGEIAFANIAIERASSPDVKAFAQMIVKDQSQTNTALAAIATQMELQPPTDLDKKHRDISERLMNVLPAEFDREYARATIDAHQEVLADLRARTGTLPRPVGTSGREPDTDPLTAWAVDVLPTVQQHLERAQQLQQNIK